MVFHWNLCDNKSPPVSRILLSILIDLNNAEIWMVTIRPPTTNSSIPLYKLLGVVPKAPITNVIAVTLKFYSFFSSQARSKYFVLLFAFLHFHSIPRYRMFFTSRYDRSEDNLPSHEPGRTMKNGKSKPYSTLASPTRLGAAVGHAGLS